MVALLTSSESRGASGTIVGGNLDLESSETLPATVDPKTRLRIRDSDVPALAAPTRAEA